MAVRTGYKSTNGKYYSAKQRNAGDRLIKEAIAEGILKQPDQCACVRCGQDRGIIHYHTEDYDNPVKAVEPWCWRCHINWHRRFFAPKACQRYFEMIDSGYRFPPVFPPKK